MKTIGLILLGAALFGQSQALNERIYEIRNPSTDSAHFRSALEKIGEILSMQVLEELHKKEGDIQTLTGAKAKHWIVDETPVLVTILRAGLPLHAGIAKVFPNAETGFLAMSRNEETLKAGTEYIALPDLYGKTVILSDTMLATGGSMLDAIQIIEAKGAAKIFVISAIASQPGIDRIAEYNSNIKIFVGAVDPALNDKGYIIPGLGDAGDRSFGKKGGKS
ncbi:MAG: uracil phosphoribosyltransferase [Verrucomicrobia bacterium]|nr:uracil phosphoribosyltransferase [Verrucomicrobiota bacterium]MBU6445794.1 uracil phosphoribosyltransferase [Verrucomicrobiota bacterium]MDE3047426.1 uracil phosphoribosyltransferase [Verrucomicrobiota bacterium]